MKANLKNKQRYHLVIEHTKKGDIFRVRTSFRDDNNKSTSRNCGSLGLVSDFIEKYKDNYLEEANKQGEALYEEWKKDYYGSSIISLSNSRDVEEDNIYYSAQLYLRSIWNKLHLPEFFNQLKKDMKGKWKYDLDELLFFLTSVQIINSCSKLSAFNSMNKYLIVPQKKTLDSLYDCLDAVAENVDAINNYTYKNVKKYLAKNSDLFFYDVTTVNLSQSVGENAIIGFKKGKEGIYGPVIQIGCVCDQWGLLVGLYIFKGSRNEQSSLQEQVEKNFSTKFKSVVICTDAGLCSAKNKRYLEQKFKGYIMTQPLSVKKVNKTIRDWAIDTPFDNVNKTKDQIIAEYEELIKEEKDQEAKALYNKTFYKSRWAICEAKIYQDDNKKEENSILSVSESKGNTPSLKDIDSTSFEVPKSKNYKKVEYSQRLVVSFSLKYYYSQHNELMKDKEKALDAINNKSDIYSKSSKDYRRFVDTKKITSDGEVAEEIASSFLQDKFDLEEKLCGLYCQATNLEDASSDIYRYSRNRWQIEYAFRTAKTFQGFGNVYLHTINHIIGHFEICFLAQQILKVLTYKIYKEVGYEKCELGKREKINDTLIDEGDFTMDKIIEELSSLKVCKLKDIDGREVLTSVRGKNEINIVMASAFGFSLTKESMHLPELLKKVK